MGLVFMIVAGGVLGWLTAFVRQLESTRSLQLNVAAGILGALLSGLAIGPIMGEASLIEGQYTVPALLISMLGAMGCIFLLNFIRGNSLR